MYFDDLNESNILLYTMKSYNSPNCIQSEFEEDIKRVKYIKKLFRKYTKNNDLKERLILNHIIILYNVFGRNATRILFYKIDEKEYSMLKTFLVYLNQMPEKIKGIKGKDIISSDIILDQKIVSKLREI